MKTIIRKTLTAAIFASFVAATSGPVEAHDGPHHGMGSLHPCETWLDGRPETIVPVRCRELATQLNQVRKATGAFHSFDVAGAAGWDMAISPCVESPMGGMGYHIANLEQLGNGSLSLLRPEALLYAPTADGSMEFLGVEYIIPDPEKTLESNPPVLMGQTFHYNPNQKIWALHVWTARSNPAGIFADWNPEVSCEFAPPPGE